MTREDVIWLAGLLEGEACFRINHTKARPSAHSPVIALAMTDRDVVERVAAMWGTNVGTRERTDIRAKYAGNKWKTVYTTHLHGRKAIALMRRLLEVNRLGQRRTAKIKDIIQQWENRPIKRLEPDQVESIRSEFINGADPKVLAKKYNVTKEAINRHVADIRAEQEQERFNALVADFKAGLSHKELALKYDLARGSVSRFLCRHGLGDPVRSLRWEKYKQRVAQNDCTDAIVADSKAGLTRKELALKYNLDKDTIGRIQRKAGVYDPVGLRRWQTRRQGV